MAELLAALWRAVPGTRWQVTMAGCVLGGLVPP